MSEDWNKRAQDLLQRAREQSIALSKQILPWIVAFGKQILAWIMALGTYLRRKSIDLYEYSREKLKIPRVRNTVITIGVILLLMILSRIIYPLESLAIEVRADDLMPGFTNSMLVILLVDIALIVVAVLATANMKEIPGGLQNVMEAIIEALYNLFRGINADYVQRSFAIVATIFFLVILSNWAGLLPGMGSIGMCYSGEHAAEESVLKLAVNSPVDNLLPPSPFAEGSKYLGCDETHSGIIPFFRSPSADLNFTLALALISVGYTAYLSFEKFGTSYRKKFFNTRGIQSFVGVLEFISLLARIPAFTFRLFGNIFAGEVLLIVMIFLIPLVVPLPFYLFEVFVGFIQAFVFAVLTMAFIAIETDPHGIEDHDEHHHDHAHDEHDEHDEHHQLAKPDTYVEGFETEADQNIAAERAALETTDLAPGDDKPADQQPDDKPADQQPDDKPADQQPDDKPADQQPDDKPADQQPDDKPADQQPDDETTNGTNPTRL